MKVAITSQDTCSDFLFEGEPWNSFAHSIESHGHRIVKMSENPEVVIFNNFSRNIFRRISREIPVNRRFLVVWEPPCNSPENFRSENKSRFAKILFPSPIWEERFGGIGFPWPQNTKPLKIDVDWTKRIDKFCLMQANRWRFSARDRYSLRRRILETSPEYIDLYGRNWNQGAIIDALRLLRALPDSIEERSFSLRSTYGIGATYSSYKGVATDKLEVLQGYRYSLVIENSDEYVSEKLVDALLARTIPVYVGANLQKFNFPENIAKVCLPTVQSIRSAMHELQSSQEEQNQLLSNAQNFLTSDFFLSLNNKKVLSALANVICENIS